jgi:hypothetical protein
MHAAMIMLVDLYERPTSVEAPRSRAFIDQTFAMSGPDGGIVSGEDGVTVQRPLREGGREAWELLRKLREKAWRKAGLDPNILWTEESQINAGVAQPLTEAQRMAQSMREDVLHDPIDVGSNDEPKTTSSAGVQNIMSSAIHDMLGSESKPPSKLPAVANTIKRGAWRPLNSFPPASTLPSQPTMPAPAPGAASGYFGAAPSIAASPHDPNLTRTSTASQENNPATVDSLRLDILGATLTPLDSAAPLHEEHHDEDFWSKWDSILGSHAGFTYEDMMEDIKWDNLGEHDENMN